MPDRTKTRHLSRRVIAAALGALIAACTQMSVIERDDTAGINGSFEIVRSDLPVNWNLHSPPLEQGDAEITFDTTDAPDGRQALELQVRRVAGAGWRAPGLFQVVPAEAGRAYIVSFWLKTTGNGVHVALRSEAPMEASEEVDVPGLAEFEPNVWRRFEQRFVVPEAYENIRFELEVATPGTVWIDDVRIEPEHTAAPGEPM